MTASSGETPVQAPDERSDETTAVEWSARAGYLAKGVVYVMVGAIALDAAFGTGPIRGARGALGSLRDEPFGLALLALIAVGLLGYAFWRVYAAVKDAEHHGADAKGLATRAGLGVTGLIYGSLALYTFSLLIGAGGGSGGPGTRGWSAVVVGLAVLVYGGVELYRAHSERFLRHWRLAEMSPVERRWGVRFGKAGLYARGVVFLVLGGLFLSNAAVGGPSPGMRDALLSVERWDHGGWLLAPLALGLIAYGCSCVIDARYRRIDA